MNVANDTVKYPTEHGEIELSPQTIRQYLVSGNGNVTDQEVMMFLKLCQYQKLNPFLREAYLIKYGDNNQATIVTGKEVFTKRASKKEQYDGFDAGIILQKGNELVYRPGSMFIKTEILVGGWAEIYRKDWKRPVRAEVALSEYIRYKKDGSLMPNWRNMPATMIRKVALVQALREAFPEDLQGMYSQEEMPIDDSSLETKTVEVTTKVQESEQARKSTTKPAETTKPTESRQKQSDKKTTKTETVTTTEPVKENLIGKQEETKLVLTKDQVLHFYDIVSGSGASKVTAKLIMDDVLHGKMCIDIETGKPLWSKVSKDDYDKLCGLFESRQWEEYFSKMMALEGTQDLRDVG